MSAVAEKKRFWVCVGMDFFFLGGMLRLRAFLPCLDGPGVTYVENRKLNLGSRHEFPPSSSPKWKQVFLPTEMPRSYLVTRYQVLISSAYYIAYHRPGGRTDGRSICAVIPGRKCQIEDFFCRITTTGSGESGVTNGGAGGQFSPVSAR